MTRRRRQPRRKSVEEIVHEAIKAAIGDGYDRGQVGVALVGGAYNLVSTWADDDRREVVAAMELRQRVLADGIDEKSFRQLQNEHQFLLPS